LKIIVVIPAYNEAQSIAKVIAEIPDFVFEIIVSDNNSTDGTGEIAQKAGASVIFASQKGYGSACLEALKYIKNNIGDVDVVVFLDGDYSDYPAQMSGLIDKINEGFDLVIGSRKLGLREKGSMTAPQIFGNWLACTLMRLFYQSKFTDLGPFRAIKYQQLLALEMSDTDFGWTVEMQLKAIHQKLLYTEVAVDYKNRIGKSKISGTVKGVLGAGFKIIYLIFKYRK